MQHEKMPLGSLVWFQTAAHASHPRIDMQSRMDSAGVPPSFMPSQRHAMDALRLAIAETSKEFSQIPLEENMVGGLIFKQVKGADGVSIWDAHLQVSNSVGKEVSYRKVAHIEVPAPTEFQCQILDESDPLLASAIESLPVKAAWFSEWLDSNQIRAMATEYVNSLGGVRVRTGVSFLNPAKVSKLEAFSKCLENLESGTVLFSAYEMDATEKNVNTLRNDYKAGLEETISNLRQKVQDASVKAKPEAELKRLQAELAEISRQFNEMSGIVGQDRGNATLLQELKRLIEAGRTK